MDLTLDEVKAIVLVVLLLWVRLRSSLGSSMIRPQFWHELRSVLCGVDSQGLWNDEKSGSEFGDGELLAGSDGASKVLQEDGEGGLDGTSSWDDGARFEGTLDGTERVVDGTLHLVELEFVGATEDDGGRAVSLGALDEDALVVGYPLLDNLFGVTERGALKDFIAFKVGEGGDEGSTSGFGDAAEIFLLATTDGNGLLLNKHLEAEIVNTLGGEDDVGAGVKDLLDAFEDHGGFALTNLFELGWVIDGDVDAEGHTGLLEVDVQTGDLGSYNAGLHGLGSYGAVEGVSLDENRFPGGFAVGLQDVDGLDGVFDIASVVDGLDGLHSFDAHFREKVGVGSNDLGGHGGLCNVGEGILGKRVDGNRHVSLEVAERLPQCHSVTCYYGSWVNLVLDEFVRSTEEFGGHQDDCGCSISNLKDTHSISNLTQHGPLSSYPPPLPYPPPSLICITHICLLLSLLRVSYLGVLLFGQIYQYLSGGMLNVQKPKNRSTIVRHCDILQNPKSTSKYHPRIPPLCRE